jgi:hypothetical protein
MSFWLLASEIIELFHHERVFSSKIHETKEHVLLPSAFWTFNLLQHSYMSDVEMYACRTDVLSFFKNFKALRNDGMLSPTSHGFDGMYSCLLPSGSSEKESEQPNGSFQTIATRNSCSFSCLFDHQNSPVTQWMFSSDIAIPYFYVPACSGLSKSSSGYYMFCSGISPARLHVDLHSSLWMFKSRDQGMDDLFQNIKAIHACSFFCLLDFQSVRSFSACPVLKMESVT